MALAEVIDADKIVIGVNAIDYSGYPDCRPEFIAAFQALARLATKRGVEGGTLTIDAPLVTMSKAGIIRRGRELGVDYSLTVSCYQADDQGRACGRCDSCRLRREGFVAAGVADPTRYSLGPRSRAGLPARELPVYNVRPRSRGRFRGNNGPLAQLVEHWTFNPLVAGSSPARPTTPDSGVRHHLR